MSYRLALTSLFLVLFSSAFAGTSICGAGKEECLLIGTPPAHILVDADGAVHVQFHRQTLTVDGIVMAQFSIADATLVIGDWDGDGFDEPGAYADGRWILQTGWELSALQHSVDMTEHNPGPDAVPLVGSWQGSAVDGIGFYDNGVFTLFSDYNDLSQAIVIDFGNIPNNKGTVWESMPFVGPIDNVMDRVGLSKVILAAYAPDNSAATYDFMGQDTALVSGILPFRGFLDAGYARPYVLDTTLLPDLPDAGYILSYRFLPGTEPEPGEQCVPSGGYQCFDGWLGKPEEAGSVIIPIADPFK